jgi:ubiquitin carboxyl-terminal hydrolase 34
MCRNILTESLSSNFLLFEIIFRLIYENFEKCNKESLFTEYFELFSELLEMLTKHPDVLEKLQLNWIILTKSIIDLFRAHKCTEERLSSPVDWVVQGFMRILSKLLTQDTLSYFVELVPYLFQNLLFPEGGVNKLKTAATRKEAYELIYNICALEGSKPDGPSGLELLFESGFKRIYKTMSTQKVQTYSYYYNSFNEIRSELGYSGIRNLGCICYMIAMIQQFYLVKPFRHLLLMADDGQPECLVKRGLKEIDDNILHQFQNMFGNLELTERQEYNPDEFCFSFKDFEGNPVNVSIQQDAQEFLNMIFDKLEKGIKDTPFRHILDNVYGGRSCTQLTCSKCKAVKQRHENFYNLSL